MIIELDNLSNNQIKVALFTFTSDELKEQQINRIKNTINGDK